MGLYKYPCNSTSWSSLLLNF